MSEQVIQLQTDALKIHPRNQEFFDDIEGKDYETFKQSILDNGVITPIIVAPDMTIISGHQRHKACLDLGIKMIPAIIREDLVDDDSKVRQLIAANFGRLKNDDKKQRKVAAEYVRLCGKPNGGNRKAQRDNRTVNLDEIAEQLGTNRRTLQELLEIDRKLIPELTEMLDSGIFTKTTASKILVKLSAEEQEELIAVHGKDIIEGATQKQMQEYVDKIKELDRKLKNIEDLENKISENEEEQRRLKIRISELVQAGTKTETITKEVEKPETLEKIKTLENQLEEKTQQNIKYSTELIENHKLLSKAMGESTNYQLVSHCSEITLKMLDFVKEMSKYDYMAESFNEIPNATRIEYEKCIGAVKKWADRIFETIHPQDKKVETVVYEDLSTSQESASETEIDSMPESIRIAQEMLANTLEYDDSETVSAPIEPADTKSNIITEIDPIGYREEILQDNREQYPLSKVFHMKLDIPRYHFYRNLEITLCLCDENGNLLVPYATYEMHMIRYKPENHDVTIIKINETIKNSTIYNNIKL